MAKRRSAPKKASGKKKSTRSAKSAKARAKEVAPEHELPGGFWRQVVAVLMLVLADWVCGVLDTGTAGVARGENISE